MSANFNFIKPSQTTIKINFLSRLKFPCTRRNRIITVKIIYLFIIILFRGVFKILNICNITGTKGLDYDRTYLTFF